MIEILLISIVALAASLLTFFSGFGLGTILMPFIALFLPLELAIAVTAVVHFANNIFKFGLVYKSIDYKVLLSFGIAAMIFSVFGALLLTFMGEINPLFTYSLFGMSCEVTFLKLSIGILILIFIIVETYPKFADISFDTKYIPLGGMISGFFGGLSGHQGAFRSMFLLKAGLTKESFVATGIAIAVMVDMARLSIYGASFAENDIASQWQLIMFATISAFLGSYFGAKLLKKVTIETVKYIVSIVVSLLAVLFILGIL